MVQWLAAMEAVALAVWSTCCIGEQCVGEANCFLTTGSRCYMYRRSKARASKDWPSKVRASRCCTLHRIWTHTQYVLRCAYRPTDMWCTCDVIPSRKVATEYARERKCNSKQLTKETADLNDIDILKSARLPYTTSFRPTRPLLL